MLNRLLRFVLVIWLIMPVTTIFGQVDTLTILHINDTHSCLAPLAPRTVSLEGTRGGIARAATVIGMAKMNDPNVLTLHAGDIFVGDLFFNVFFGVAEFKLLKSIGFDAVTLGNHEFDLTPQTLETSLLSSFFPNTGIPILSVNLVCPPELCMLDEYVLPFKIKEIGGIKVGMFGLTTPSANLLSQPAPAFVDTNITEIAFAMSDTLSKEGCGVVICLSHLGFALDRLIAENVPGIDVIVGGHDHFLFEQPVEVINPEGKKTLIVQAGAFYQNVGKMQLKVSPEGNELLCYTMIGLNDNIPEEPTVKAQVDLLTAQIEETYGPVYTQQITQISKTWEEYEDSLTFDGWYDTPLGNYIADAFRLSMETDIGIEPSGSISQALYEGPVVAADVFRAVGYGFNEINGLGYRIVTFDVTGMDLMAGLEFGLSDIENIDDFLIQVSGMKYMYNPVREPYSRLTYVEVGGESVNPAAIYSVATNELALHLLTQMLELPVSNVIVMDSLTEFQLLGDYLINSGAPEPEQEGRITAARIPVNVDETLSQPESFILYQNYPNPFNAQTNISFNLPNAEYVTIKIFNALGQEVVTLARKAFSRGKHTVRWNADGMVSGIYLMQIEATKYKAVSKLTLLK